MRHERLESVQRGSGKAQRPELKHRGSLAARAACGGGSEFCERCGHEIDRLVKPLRDQAQGLPGSKAVDCRCCRDGKGQSVGVQVGAHRRPIADTQGDPRGADLCDNPAGAGLDVPFSLQADALAAQGPGGSALQRTGPVVGLVPYPGAGTLPDRGPMA
jgi:hypothetical protein